MNNLIPTPIVDKNGKQTTVHKSLGNTPAATGALSAARPSLIASKKKERPTTLEWNTRQLPLDEGLLWEMGISEHRGTTRFTEITLSELIGYLGHGATYHEAAYLNRIKGLEEWERDERFQRAAERCPNQFDNVIAAIESRKMKPNEIFKLLENGVTDALLESSTLTEDQTLNVFSRFKYSHHTASKTSNEIPAMIDALLDGTLPYGVFDGGYEKASVTKMCKELFGNPGKKSEFTEAEREEIRSSPETIELLLALTDHHNKNRHENDVYGAYRAFGETYRAVKQFGKKAVSEFHPQLLQGKLSDGSVMGVEGARTARGFVQYCEDKTPFELNQYAVTSLTARDQRDAYGRSSGSRFTVELTEVVEMSRAGVTDAAMVHCLTDLKMSVPEILEQAKNPAPLLMEGTL
jgi:hypothetical protein